MVLCARLSLNSALWVRLSVVLKTFEWISRGMGSRARVRFCRDNAVVRVSDGASAFW